MRCDVIQGVRQPLNVQFLCLPEKLVKLVGIGRGQPGVDEVENIFENILRFHFREKDLVAIAKRKRLFEERRGRCGTVVIKLTFGFNNNIV